MNKNKSIQGFTLIELMIVMLIGGLLIYVFSSFLQIAISKALKRESNAKIELINNELNRYVETFGRFPCPASLTAAIDTAEFGVEAGLASGDVCSSSTNFPGVTLSTGRGGRLVRVGALPVRALNLPDEYIFDSNRVRFIYAVTADMADESKYKNDIGAIYIRDSKGNPTIIPDGSAPYVVVSMGENKSGGYTGITGSQMQICSAVTSTLEQENCNQDAFFIDTILSSTNPSTYFDDIIITQYKYDEQSMPSNSVVFFDSPSCPVGWQSFYGTGTLDGLIPCKKL